ncbi:MAG: ROK family protein [Clostridia bacterium]|nr:ROK family protein [Clostridia bacterium]
MTYALGIDIGGTKIAIGIMNSDNEMLCTDSFLIEGMTAISIFVKMQDTIEELVREAGLKKDDISSIGIGVPGIINKDRRSVLFAPNIPLLNDFPLYRSLRNMFPDAAIVLENDANAAGLAESILGAGKNFDNMIYCTISTGVGAGIIIDHKLFRGSHLAAGEIGHMITFPDGEPCGCGNRGCAEAYAGGANYPKYIRHVIDSGRETILKDYLEAHGTIDGRALSFGLDNHDALAEEVFSKICRTIGILFFNLYKCLNIDCYILGGGLTNLGDKLFTGIEENFQKLRVGADTMEKVYFLPAHFTSNEIGVYGAALVALENR